MSTEQHPSLDDLATISEADLLAAICGIPSIRPSTEPQPYDLAALLIEPAPDAQLAQPPSAFTDDLDWAAAGDVFVPDPEPTPAAPASQPASSPPSDATQGKRKRGRPRTVPPSERVARQREIGRASQQRFRERREAAAKLHASFFEWVGEHYPNIVAEFKVMHA